MRVMPVTDENLSVKDEVREVRDRLNLVYEELKAKYPSKWIDNKGHALELYLEDEEDALLQTEAVIRSILALPKSLAIPATSQEVELFQLIVGIMNRLNKKWKQTSQICYEFGLTRESEPPRGSILQERFVESSNETNFPRGLELREVFFSMLKACLNNKDLDFINRGIQKNAEEIDSEQLREYFFVTAEKTLIDLQTYIFAEVRLYHNVRPGKLTPSLLNIETIKATHLRIKKGLEAFLKYTPAWQGLEPDTDDVAADSLFSKLLLNAILNKHLLEQWAYEMKKREVLKHQSDLLNLVSNCYPEGGLGKALDEFVVDDNGTNTIDYVAMCYKLLGIDKNTKKGMFNARILEKIQGQVEAIIGSAYKAQFSGEVDVNKLLSSSETRHKHAWVWLALMYFRLKDVALLQCDPEQKSRPRKVVTSNLNSTIVQDGELMTTLRSLVSALNFSVHEYDFSVERIQAHFGYVQDVRFQYMETLERLLRRNAIDAWEQLAKNALYCTQRRKGEVH